MSSLRHTSEDPLPNAQATPTPPQQSRHEEPSRNPVPLAPNVSKSPSDHMSNLPIINSPPKSNEDVDESMLSFNQSSLKASHRTKLTTQDIRLILYLITCVKPFKYVGDRKIGQTRKWEIIQTQYEQIKRSEAGNDILKNVNDEVIVPTVRTLQRQLANAVKKVRSRISDDASLLNNQSDLQFYQTITRQSSVIDLEFALFELHELSESLKNGKGGPRNSVSPPLSTAVNNTTAPTLDVGTSRSLLTHSETPLSSSPSNDEKSRSKRPHDNDVADEDKRSKFDPVSTRPSRAPLQPKILTQPSHIASAPVLTTAPASAPAAIPVTTHSMFPPPPSSLISQHEYYLAQASASTNAVITKINDLRSTLLQELGKPSSEDTNQKFETVMLLLSQIIQLNREYQNTSEQLVHEQMGFITRQNEYMHHLVQANQQTRLQQSEYNKQLFNSIADRFKDDPFPSTAAPASAPPTSVVPPAPPAQLPSLQSLSSTSSTGSGPHPSSIPSRIPLTSVHTSSSSSVPGTISDTNSNSGSFSSGVTAPSSSSGTSNPQHDKSSQPDNNNGGDKTRNRVMLSSLQELLN